jgi:hypothetical protein
LHLDENVDHAIADGLQRHTDSAAQHDHYIYGTPQRSQ